MSNSNTKSQAHRFAEILLFQKLEVSLPNDKALPKASWEEVEWALSDYLKEFKKSRNIKDFIDMIGSDSLWAEFKAGEEELCIRMGWSYQEHRDLEHNAIMAEINSQN